MPFRIGPWEIALLLFMLPAFAIYLAPTIVAIARHARNVLGIVLLNILGGWTLVGWIIALVWSIRDERKAKCTNDNP